MSFSYLSISALINLIYELVPLLIAHLEDASKHSLKLFFSYGTIAIYVKKVEGLFQGVILYDSFGIDSRC